jgi:hypothetical protein
MSQPQTSDIRSETGDAARKATDPNFPHKGRPAYSPNYGAVKCLGTAGKGHYWFKAYDPKFPARIKLSVRELSHHKDEHAIDVAIRNFQTNPSLEPAEARLFASEIVVHVISKRRKLDLSNDPKSCFQGTLDLLDKIERGEVHDATLYSFVHFDQTPQEDPTPKLTLHHLADEAPAETPVMPPPARSTLVRRASLPMKPVADLSSPAAASNLGGASTPQVETEHDPLRGNHVFRPITGSIPETPSDVIGKIFGTTAAIAGRSHQAPVRTVVVATKDAGRQGKPTVTKVETRRLPRRRPLAPGS